MMKYLQNFKKVECKHFINGEYVESKGQETFDVVNPATEEIIGKACKGNQEDVDLAVKAARDAFKVWSNYDAVKRGSILMKASELIIKNKEMLAYFQTLNCGKPIAKTFGYDIPFVAYIYSYYAGQADKIKGSTLQMMSPYVGMIIKEPVGVVGAILPWNHPLNLMAWKMGAALAAGCTVVLKPAEQTPYTTLMICDLMREAGLPPGVLNVVTGEGATGELVSTHKDVDKVAFTGSTEIGKHVISNAHKHSLKRMNLELGGKSAMIICPDADMNDAVPTACLVWNNCGQNCIAASRVFVHESIYDEFLEKAIKFAEGIVHGDPLDMSTTQGPLNNKVQYEKTLYYIEEGKKEGAKVATGGERWGDKGYFIKPTIFVNVDDSMRIAKEEIFGPVMCILKWKDEDEVIERANSLPFGLAAGIMTTNLDKAIKFSRRLEAGTIHINNYAYKEGCTAFGGFKDSGLGKDLGDEGLEGYLQAKTIIIKSKM